MNIPGVDSIIWKSSLCSKWTSIDQFDVLNSLVIKILLIKTNTNFSKNIEEFKYYHASFHGITLEMGLFYFIMKNDLPADHCLWKY